MKTINEREMQKATKEKQTKVERSNGNRNYSEIIELSLFHPFTHYFIFITHLVINFIITN